MSLADASVVGWHVPDFELKASAEGERVAHVYWRGNTTLSVVRKNTNRPLVRPWQVFESDQYRSSHSTAAKAMLAADRLAGLGVGEVAQYEREIARLCAGRLNF